MDNWNAVDGELAALLALARRLGIPRPDARFGVGKRMGDAVWLHRSAADAVTATREAARGLPDGFAWTVVRWRGDGSVAFIASPGFDAEDEPAVGDSWLLRPGQAPSLTRRPADPWIWHHRWTMVRPSYTGFDVAAAVRRSLAWKRVVGVDRALSSRIGKRSVWEREVIPRLAAG